MTDKMKNTTNQLIYAVLLLWLFNSCFAQKLVITSKIDELISAKAVKPFNGVILINQKGKNIYSNIFGYSNLENKTSLKSNDQFVIGSISKQFTAVLVLQEYDKGHLKLQIPIRNYLPELTQSWADTITIHQLLTHTHGISFLNKPVSFKPGTKYEYSQIGYDLLAKIVEKTTKQSFASLSKDLFDTCEMKNTFHPDSKMHKDLVKAYSEGVNHLLEIEKESFKNYVGAGAFISTADDLILWNKKLFEGNLLSQKTFKLMTTKQKGATRNHPLFGKTNYGYGITVDTKDSILQYGQTGFAPGFVSMNFYFPESKTSVVILENTVWDPNDLKKTFHYHTQILNILRQSIRNKS
jgi:D-alanyl-D-alanine carboxypeptidase